MVYNYNMKLEQTKFPYKIIPEHEKKYRFTTGELHKYRGHYYPLIVKPTDDPSEDTAEICQGHLVLHSSNPKSPVTNAAVLDEWYYNQAKALFAGMVAKAMLNAAPYVKGKMPRLRIKRMLDQWGACNPRTGLLILNLELIKVPDACTAFVAQHEVMHLKYPSHNNAFFAAMKSVMPDWVEREKILKTYYPV